MVDQIEMSKGAREEAMAAPHNSSCSAADGEHGHGAVVKGKRTKRMRLLQVLAPRVPAAAAAGSSSGEQSAAGSTTTEEEVDTANSLIMLAERPVVRTAVANSSETRLEEDLGGRERVEDESAAVGGISSVESIVYRCKTCSKCFPSFQALGGHRASHSKPKTLQQANAEIGRRAVGDDGEIKERLASSHTIHIDSVPDVVGGRGARATVPITTTNRSNNNHTNSNNMITESSSNNQRLHECAICGSAFSSGQALGGHMRRHRAPAGAAPVPKIERSILPELDLNLPAPTDDENSSPSFGSSAGKRPLIFLPSAMVDCHH